MDMITDLNGTIKINEEQIETLREQINQIQLNALEVKKQITINLKTKKTLTTKSIKLFEKRMSLLRQKEDLNLQIHKLEIKEREILKGKNFETIEEYMDNVNPGALMHSMDKKKIDNSRLFSENVSNIEQTQLMNPQPEEILVSKESDLNVETRQISRRKLICNPLNITKSRSDSRRNIEKKFDEPDEWWNSPEGCRAGSKLTEETGLMRNERLSGLLGQVETLRQERGQKEIKRESLGEEIKQVGKEIQIIKKKIREIDLERKNTLGINTSLNGSVIYSQVYLFEIADFGFLWNSYFFF